MIDLFVQAAWKVLVAGLVLGAGLPALFGLGVRLAAEGAGDTTTMVRGPRPAYRLLATICFVACAVAVLLGIMVIVAAGFGKAVSFEHVLPTLVDKS
jgi:hypothetical protein